MYPGGSCSGESAREQLDAGDHEPCFGACNRGLEVFCKTTIAVEPGDGSFDNPAAWQQFEALAASDRLPISMVQRPIEASAFLSFGPA